MNMAGMNPASGGPVGGGMIMMVNNGNHHPAASSSSHSDLKRRLDTYIYDYFLKNGHHEHARALFRDDSIKLNTHPHTKASPSRRRDGEMNGIDENAMDTDSKDDVNKIPDDLPKPDVPDNAQSGFLYDWFGLFFDIYGASRSKKPDDSSTAAQYLQQTQMMQRMRETQHSSSVLGRQGMMPNRQFGPQNMRNGMSQDVQRAMAAKQMSPAQYQQLQQHQQHQQQKHNQMLQQMQREQSENEMNGHRPQSPASTDNAGSPSKRPRLEGQQFAGGPMAPNGRGQGGPQQQQQAIHMLMANGMNGRNISQSQFQIQAQNPGMQKNLQVYAQNLAQQQGRSMMNQGAMPNGMMNPGVMPNQGSPMLGPVDGQIVMQGMAMESMLNNPQQMAALRHNMQAGNSQGGNHALQDYQMQLMLLEQQNKKRLLMARQEQDNITRTDGGPPMPGQPGMQPSGMSPASRAEASPNPSDQMKRAQLGANGMPASPSAGDGMPQARGSPAGMNFAGGMPQDFNNQLYVKNMAEGMVGPGGPGMRPPTSMNPAMNMEAIARQQGGRMPSGNWHSNPQGQPMMQQPPPSQPQAMGTPQQRAGEMPPPSAPAAGNGPSQRNPPHSPPTPSQSNKPNPKGKKDKNEPKKRLNKRNSTANAPSASEADHPATPTPSTPTTSVNQASFAKGPNGPASGNAPTSNPTPSSNPPAPQQQPPAVDPTAGAGAFGDFNAPSEPFNLDFSGIETADVLENFDFDSFLHSTDDGNNGFPFDPAMSFPEGLETGGME